MDLSSSRHGCSGATMLECCADGAPARSCAASGCPCVVRVEAQQVGHRPYGLCPLDRIEALVLVFQYKQIFFSINIIIFSINMSLFSINIYLLPSEVLTPPPGESGAGEGGVA